MTYINERLKNKVSKDIFLNIWRKKKIIIPLVLILALAIGLYVYIVKQRNKVYVKYAVENTIEIDSSIATEYKEFQGGILRYSTDGISFYKGGKEIFNKAIQMPTPVIDVNGDYIAMAERSSTEINLFDEKGSQKNITATHSIVGLAVSEKGVVAAILDDGAANYIEIYDKEGAKLVSGRTVLEGDGYPISISLSEDATKLAASYLAVSESQTQSKVVFYNYSSVGENEVDRIVGGFNQYKNTIVPVVKFINNNTVIAVGDDMFSIYSIDQKPKLRYEESFDNRVETVFYSSRYIGIVFDSNDQTYSHVLKVYDKNGKIVFVKSLDFNYSDIHFAGENVVLNDSVHCIMYSFKGKERFNGNFDKNIVKLIPISDDKYILVSDNTIEELKLK